MAWTEFRDNGDRAGCSRNQGEIMQWKKEDEHQIRDLLPKTPEEREDSFSRVRSLGIVGIISVSLHFLLRHFLGPQVLTDPGILLVSGVVTMGIALMLWAWKKILGSKKPVCLLYVPKSTGKQWYLSYDRPQDFMSPDVPSSSGLLFDIAEGKAYAAIYHTATSEKPWGHKLSLPVTVLVGERANMLFRLCPSCHVVIEGSTYEPVGLIELLDLMTNDLMKLRSMGVISVMKIMRTKQRDLLDEMQRSQRILDNQAQVLAGLERDLNSRAQDIASLEKDRKERLRHIEKLEGEKTQLARLLLILLTGLSRKDKGGRMQMRLRMSCAIKHEDLIANALKNEDLVWLLQMLQSAAVPQTFTSILRAFFFQQVDLLKVVQELRKTTPESFGELGTVPPEPPVPPQTA